MKPASPVAFVVKGYPRLSETFIAQEILALEQQGLPIMLFSLRRPSTSLSHAMHEKIKAPVIYLPEYLYQAPLLVLRSWLSARRLPGYARARQHWWRDLRRDFSANRGRRIGQALVLASVMGPEFTRLHAHFLHTPASVARYAAMLRKIPWSFSAHAKDIWTTPEWELREKIADSAWGTICTNAGAARLRDIASPSNAQKLSLNYHGLDLDRFPCPPSQYTAQDRDGDDPDAPVRVISIGRAVYKKGFDVLLNALALLPAQLQWRLTHIGGGPLSAEYRDLAEKLGLGGRIAWMGECDQAAVIEALRSADLFALACRIDPNGDRDGLPNVLLEAQSQALPCISTNISAIPELIINGETGLLTPPDDAPSFSRALAELMRDPAQRARMGAKGRLVIEQRFQMQHCIGRLALHFGLFTPRVNP